MHIGTWHIIYHIINSVVVNIKEVSGIHSLGTINVCSKFHDCQDFSLDQSGGPGKQLTLQSQETSNRPSI